MNTNQSDNENTKYASEVSVDPNVLHRLQLHAKADYPRECCGFLYGRADGLRRILQARRAANASRENRKRRFRIDPADYRGAERYAEENGLDLLGVYHSHPDHPAEPSEHDRSVAMPWFSYLILSVNGDKVKNCRSWRLNEDRAFEEEKLIIEEPSTQETPKE